MKIFFIVALCILKVNLTLAKETRVPKTSLSLLTSEEVKILNIGPLENPRYITGGVLGTSIGFGLGHIVQGRWQEKGWIFTLGESASLITALGAGTLCITRNISSNVFTGEDDDYSLACWITNLALASFVGFKIWEGVDLWHGGYLQRENYKNLKIKMEQNSKKFTYNVTPMSVANNFGLGLTIQF